MQSQEIPQVGDGAAKDDKPLFEADLSGGPVQITESPVSADRRFAITDIERLFSGLESKARCGELEETDLAHLPRQAQDLAWDAHTDALESPMQYLRLGLYVAAAGQFDRSTPQGQAQLDAFVGKVMSGLNDGMKPEAIRDLVKLTKGDQKNLPIIDCVFKNLEPFDPNSRAGQLAAREAKGENTFTEQMELTAHRIVKMSSAPNKTDADIALVKDVLTGNREIHRTDKDYARLQILLKSPIKGRQNSSDVPIA